MFYKLNKSNLTSIYNTRIKCFKGTDTVLVHKVQNVSGTVDEKLPYLFHSLANAPYSHKLLVLEGEGWREGALDWIENILIMSPIKLFFSVEEANRYLEDNNA